ncbi:serine hydrolase domain-containing protein [Thalassobacillus hwangdonensis]|uniref:Serine hydrolase domain-containing protein n=1 Tax=Thalassobacillus hwangdonensis TaxID=546108 RepID=A0ABW3L4B3_9BACI
MMDVKETIDGLANEQGVSGTLLVKQGDEVRLEMSYGFANKAEKIENNLHTRFGVASGCKLFTAIGIAQLVDQGLLTFDTKLKDCLELSFPNFDDRVTIHHLLTHTSGVPDYFDEEVMNDYEDLWKTRPVYTITKPEDFLPMFQDGNMLFHPGERFHYNNAGYILLGLVIQQLSGMNFTDYIEEKVFKECGMVDSGYFSSDCLPENTALGYIEDKEEGTWKTNIFSIPIKGGPDGGAYVTAPDMVKVWEALFSYKLISKSVTDQMLQPYMEVNNFLRYGYGMWMNEGERGIYKYHVMGFDPGVRFRASYYPEKDLKIIAACNNEVDPFDMVKTIEDEFLE